MSRTSRERDKITGTEKEVDIMTIQLRKSTVINRPIQEVWSYLDDEANDPVWRRPYIKKVTRIETGPSKPGTRFQGIFPDGPYLTEVTHYEPPVSMAWKFVSYPARPVKEREGSYLLSQEGQGTRMTLEVTADASGMLGTVMSFPFSILVRTILAPQLLKHLKQGVEGQTTASSST
jgi:uncharacterized protein YndB with AHSA1/START domain